MSSGLYASVAAWEYQDIAPPPSASQQVQGAELTPESQPPQRKFSEEDVSAQVRDAVATARSEWQREFQEELSRRDRQLSTALRCFAREQTEYFRYLEADVVQLSLAVARKVLDHEVHLDPTLLSGLIRVALDRVGPSTPVTLRVSPSMEALWTQAVSGLESQHAFILEVDKELAAEDCRVDTALGSANVGLGAQLKEIEQSFENVLARRREGA